MMTRFFLSIYNWKNSQSTRVMRYNFVGGHKYYSHHHFQILFQVPRKMEIVSISFTEQIMLMLLVNESAGRSTVKSVPMRRVSVGTRQARQNL
jgi:hypothetical protein